VLVTVYLVNEPPLVHGATPAEGAWISFGGALLMALGALLRNSRVALVVSPRSEPAPPAAQEPPPTAPPPPGAREQTDTQVLPER
jgi:hypothetical protein